MRPIQTQFGYTLITTSLVVLCLGILTVSAVRHALISYEDARIQAVIGEARDLVNYVDMARQKVTTTTIDANNVYTHGYPTLAANATVSQFNTAFGTGIAIGNASEFGTNYRININNNTAWVTVRIPIPGLTPPGVGAVPVGTTATDLVFYPTRSKAKSMLLNQAHTDKQSLYQESRR